MNGWRASGSVLLALAGALISIPSVAASELAQIFGEVVRDGYPWARRLVAAPARAADRIESAMRRGCSANLTMVYAYTYGDFLRDLQAPENYQGFHERRGLTALAALLRRAAGHNRHLWACPFAVVKGLQLFRIYLLNAILNEGARDQTSWEFGWHELTFIDNLLGILLCKGCGQKRFSAFADIWQRSSWRPEDWMTKLWFDHWHSVGKIGDVEAAQASSADLLNDVMNSTDVGDRRHVELLRDGKLLMERLREAGLVRSWVVARGTMFFAMRYGHTRGLDLPSGIQDMPKVPPLDMDVYVLTDSKEHFIEKLYTYAQEFGFKFCGWLKGWPENTIVCLREGGELELTLAKLNVASLMLPSSRCLVRSLPTPTSVAAAAAATADDAIAPAGGGAGDAGSVEGEQQQGTIVVELPCPRDPMAFMRHYWDKTHADLLECLPLPMSLKGERQELTQEDVRFLWKRAQELHFAGYASMAPYFPMCRGQHPLVEFARELAIEGGAWL